MELSMREMGSAFLLSVLLGIIFGLCYDPLRILRIIRGERGGAFSRVLTAAEDFLLLAVYGALFSIFVYAVNDGVVRGFMLIGVALGFFAYYFTVGRLVMAASERIIALLKRAIRYAVKAIARPMRRVIGFVYRYTLSPIIQLLLRIYLYFLSLPIPWRSIRCVKENCGELLRLEM